MAQAEHATSTSRRTFLVIAGGMATAAMAPTEAAARISTIGPKFQELRTKFTEVFEQSEACGRALNDALGACRQWEEENPEPRIRENYPVGPNETLGEAWKREQQRVDRLSGPWMQARFQTWKRVARAKAFDDWNAIQEELETAADEIYTYNCVSMEEVLAKARLVSAGYDTREHVIARSIALDLLNLYSADTA